MNKSGGSSPTKGPIKEEIVNPNTLPDIIKSFTRETAIVWHDPNANTEYNMKYAYEIQQFADLKTFVDWKETINYIQSLQIPCYALTAGSNGELFVQEASKLSNILGIYVFCGNVEFHSQWAKNYPKVVRVENVFKNLCFHLFEAIVLKWQRSNSILRTGLPAFAPFSESSGPIGPRFIEFQDRVSAKKDLLALAKAAYSDKSFQDMFENMYVQYHPHAILNWFSKETFLYKCLVNCLRGLSIEGLRYTRYLIGDLEMAIKEQYALKSKAFNGLVYKGATVSESEWTRLQENIGNEIIMLGFLSTTKNKGIEWSFAQRNADTRALITVILPVCPNKGEPGFVEMKEFSDFAAEDEVLFNIQSRFTVLEATVEEINGKKYRHVVLLHAAQAIREFMKEKDQETKLQAAPAGTIKCNICKSQVWSEDEYYVNYPTPCLCKFCAKGAKPAFGKAPLIYVAPPSLYGGPVAQNGARGLKLRGLMLLNPERFDIPFYGYKCGSCGQKGSKIYYKCTVCTEPVKTFCEKCIAKKLACVDEGHGIMMERNPYTFWCEKISERQLATIKYITEPPNVNSFDLAQHFFSIRDYAKAKKHYEKFLERGGDTNLKNKLIAQKNLGILYKDWGEESKGEKMLLKALEAAKLVGSSVILGSNPEKVFYQELIAEVCENLGMIYGKLGMYSKAKEYYLEAIGIRKASKAGDLVGLYTKLVEILKVLDEYNSAMDYVEKIKEIQGVKDEGKMKDSMAGKQIKAGPFKKIPGHPLTLIR